ncbi:hypothetical protein SLA2020_387170 [Shorea laevis]
MRMKGHASVAAHIFSSLEDVKTMTQCLPQSQSFFDSSRCIMEEKKDAEDRTLNEGEAEIAISHAKRLAYSGRSLSFPILELLPHVLCRFYY